MRTKGKSKTAAMMAAAVLCGGGQSGGDGAVQLCPKRDGGGTGLPCEERHLGR